MKVILSAFSCEPDVGSEEAVGWGWVIGLAARCTKVLVVTRARNRHTIEPWRAKNKLDNVEFIYYEPKLAPLCVKLLGRYEWIPHYLLWQRGVLKPLREAMARERYDVVHHVTVVSMRFQVRLAQLGLPFVYGPVAGGDEAPVATWKGMTLQGKMSEISRMVSNRFLRISPGARKTLESASAIISTSAQTTALVAPHLRSKVTETLAISYDQPLRAGVPSRRAGPRLRMLFAARSVDYKGLAVGLHAIAAARRAGADLHLTVIGDGPVLAHWQAIAAELQLNDIISWQKGLPRAEFLTVLPNFDLLFFPSLHDSGALVVLESLANDLPVLCLDAGGPGLLVDASCGLKVPVDTFENIVDGLASALLKFASDEDFRLQMARGSRKRIAEHFTLEKKIEAVMARYPVQLPVSRPEARREPQRV